MQKEGHFLGGVFAGQEDLNWETDFKITIEPNSMQRTEDHVIQARMMQILQMMMQVGQAMPGMPWWNWRYAVNMMGESFNQKDLWDLIFNPQFAPQFQQDPAAFPGQQLPPLSGRVNPSIGRGITNFGGIAEPSQQYAQLQQQMQQQAGGDASGQAGRILRGCHRRRRVRRKAPGRSSRSTSRTCRRTRSSRCSSSWG